MQSRRSPLLAQRRAAALCALAAALGGLLAASPAAAAPPDPARSGGSASIGVVNINTASVDELQALPGIGEARARAIVERREKSGPFDSVEQLGEIRGIGASLVERLRPHVTLRGKAPAGR